MLDIRKAQLLKLVVEYYIETAEPVGSRFLTEQSDLLMSPATVRNELHDLEEEHMLTHPHTSAGRVPTEHGYRYYVSHLMEKKMIESSFEKELSLLGDMYESEESMKSIVKAIAEYTENAVIVAFSPDRVYYTGMSRLFSQPEFKDIAQTVTVSAIFDACEDIMDDVFERVDDFPTLLFGKENPFGELCGLVGVRIGKNKEKVCAVLGPMRMNYTKTVPVMEYLSTL